VVFTVFIDCIAYTRVLYCKKMGQKIWDWLNYYVTSSVSSAGGNVGLGIDSKTLKQESQPNKAVL
jgi:hypothetical protein